MKVQNVNNNQYNVSSKANVEFILNSKKYLSKDAIKNITNRAKALGTDADNIMISIGQKPIFKEEECEVIKGGFLGAFFGDATIEKVKKERLVEIRDYVQTSGVFPSINHIESIKEKDLPLKGSTKDNAEKYLNRFMGYLESLFKEKVK